MKNDFLKGIWPDWEITGEVADGMYEAVRTDSSGERWTTIKIASIPEKESEIESFRADGRSENWIQMYLQKKVSDFIENIQLLASFKNTQSMIFIEEYKVMQKANGVGWDIYIRMERLIPLKRYMKGRILTEPESVRLGVGICLALEQCEKRGVMHRNVTVENVFVDSFGNFKLGYFGEKYRQKKDESAEPTDDLYSLGKLLRQVSGTQNISKVMEQVILCACSQDPAKRFRSATAMKNVLLSIRSENKNMQKNAHTQEKAATADYATDSTRKEFTPKMSAAEKQRKFWSSLLLVVLLLIAFFAAKVVFIFADAKQKADENGSANSSVVSENTENEEDDIQSRAGDDEQIAEILKETEKLSSDGDYETALNKIKTAVATYPTSKELKEKEMEYTDVIEEHRKIKERILNEADSMAESEDYGSALKVIKKAQDTYGDDDDYSERYSVFRDGYEEVMVAAAEELAESGDYEGAIKKIEEASELVGISEMMKEKKEEYQEEENRQQEQEKEVQQSDGSQSSCSPFYGIWCGAAKTEAEAQKQAKKIRENGFDAQVFVTTDWSNLNTEKWYVIAAGTYGTEEAASAVLPDVQRVCSDAYIKYSGNWQG